MNYLTALAIITEETLCCFLKDAHPIVSGVKDPAAEVITQEWLKTQNAKSRLAMLIGSKIASI